MTLPDPQIVCEECGHVRYNTPSGEWSTCPKHCHKLMPPLTVKQLKLSSQLMEHKNVERPKHAFLTFDGCKTFHLGITNNTGTWVTGCRIICTENQPDGIHWREPGRSECCSVCSNIYSQKKSWFRKMLAHGQPLLKFKKTHGKNRRKDEQGADYISGGL